MGKGLTSTPCCLDNLQTCPTCGGHPRSCPGCPTCGGSGLVERACRHNGAYSTSTHNYTSTDRTSYGGGSSYGGSSYGDGANGYALTSRH